MAGHGVPRLAAFKVGGDSLLANNGSVRTRGDLVSSPAAARRLIPEPVAACRQPADRRLVLLLQLQLLSE